MTVAEQLLGPVFYRRLLSRRPLTAELIEHTVETVEHVLPHNRAYHVTHHIELAELAARIRAGR